MSDLIALLRNNQCMVKYSKEYYETWTPDGALQMSDDKLLENVIELNCSNRQLTSLPQLPNCQILICDNNQITSLPQLPNCRILICSNNQLPSLPHLPNCNYMHCSNNQLPSLPPLPNCRELFCYNNQLPSLPQLPNCRILYCYKNRLTSLPQLTNCQILYCYNNQLTSLPVLNNLHYNDWSNNCLPFEELDKWEIVWKTIRLYLQIKYFRLWYKFMLQSKANKKAELHLELKWSPELQFYKDTPEYRHWHNCLQQSHFVR